MASEPDPDGDLRNRLDPRLRKVVGARKMLQANPGDPLDEEADPAVRQFEHAHDRGRRADLVEVGLLRLLDRGVALRHQQDHPVLGERLVDRADRALPAERKRNDDERIEDGVLERQDRKDVGQSDGLVQRALPRLHAGAFLLEQRLQLLHELAHVLEAAVDRGEPHVGHLVELAQPLHREGADLAGRELAVLLVRQQALGGVHDLFELAQRHRTLLAGLLETLEELAAVEVLARAVVLDHPVGDLFDFLVGREAAVAGQAFTAAPDRHAFAALARIDDPVLARSAEGAAHGNTLAQAGRLRAPARSGGSPPGRFQSLDLRATFSCSRTRSSDLAS